ncbi:MAG TPA: tetratricopeptide repeat protein [Isosphaeraceae bacterium]|nr:tetratricopeptide repeat protein [Isosphaeraceae bacterium]
MNPHPHPWNPRPVVGLTLVLILLAGCDYSPPGSFDGTGGTYKPGLIPESGTLGGGSPSSFKHTATSLRSSEERNAILDSAITLIQRAAVQPGGTHFAQAVRKLNQYFEGTNPAEYRLESAAREYLQAQLPPAMLRSLEEPTWSERSDTRHIEDCMMYYGIANRVAGTGEDLDQVRRVFDWIVRQVQLVPAGSLAAGRLGQAYARPYDVLLRGMATEAEGFWAERSWLFMALCRQLGIDTGLITYTKGNVVEPPIPAQGTDVQPDPTAPGLRKSPKQTVIWICAALIGDQVYLFDARLGQEVPGPGGQGVATLAQALADPAILERMNLPGQAPYGTSRASLLASATKIGILIDSGLGYFSPKMKLLQRELPGKYRAILYRDPAEQRDRFVRVLGERGGNVALWGLPLEVETRLFNDPQFVQSVQNSLFLFRPEFPLVYTRVKQLRGELEEAIQEYVKFRFAENLPMVTNKKVMIPREVQDGLDIYATYYLALAHLERNNLDQAELMFQKTLELLPDFGPSQPYYNMFRWGAHTNLGRIYEARQNTRAAIGHYTQFDPTSQYVGNLLRARELVWRDPMSPPPDPLPAPPPPKPVNPRPAAPSPPPRGR